MASGWFCIHGHFYQPPREDPISGEIPIEPGASPFRNWNEKINERCYKPNAELGNFERISFNIGPTLVEWLSRYDRETLDLIIEQDHKNLRRYGVGNAMAQSYNHTILPLASSLDKQTQVRWGIDDFYHWYSHKPKGMWLPETAVDLETLEILADNEILFTILAPWQADELDLDPSEPYLVELPSGKEMIVFFYQQDLSTRVSFDPGATSNADDFYNKILRPKYVENGKAKKDELFLIASDGEAYGHHHPFRDKFLNRLMKAAVEGSKIRSTFPSLWLLDQYPVKKMKIRENTSWSCHHGVKRWSEDCSCSPNGSWKKPLREAFNELAIKLDEIYLQEMGTYFQDVWQVRHDYIKMRYEPGGVKEALKSRFGKKISQSELERIALLLESQYNRQRMFTSCAWFFEDFDRIEPRNNIAYAAHAIWQAYLVSGVDLSSDGYNLLKKVQSPRTGLTGDKVFEHFYAEMLETQKQ